MHKYQHQRVLNTSPVYQKDPARQNQGLVERKSRRRSAKLYKSQQKIKESFRPATTHNPSDPTESFHEDQDDHPSFQGINSPEEMIHATRFLTLLKAFDNTVSPKDIHIFPRSGQYEGPPLRILSGRRPDNRIDFLMTMNSSWKEIDFLQTDPDKIQTDFPLLGENLSSFEKLFSHFVSRENDWTDISFFRDTPGTSEGNHYNARTGLYELY